MTGSRPVRSGQSRSISDRRRTPRYLPPAPTPPDLGRRQAALGLAVLVAIFLVLAGIVIGRATKSSSTKTVTVTAAQPEETPATTTGTDGSAAETTPDTTTPDITHADTPRTPDTSTPTTSTSAVPTGETLRPGTKGSSVTALQKALASLGYEPGTADGTYGATTAQAVPRSRPPTASPPTASRAPRRSRRSMRRCRRPAREERPAAQ